MRLFWIPTLLLLGLTSACASGAAVAPAVPVAAKVAAAPAPVPGYDWHLTPADEDGVYLAYGIAESDELKLGLRCAPGSGAVELTVPGPTGVREIRLEAGEETERFAALGEPSELHDGDLLTADTAASLPVFQRFRRLGWIAQWVGGEREVYVAQPGSETGVERFFARCG